MAARVRTIYVSNDNLLKLNGLQNGDDLSYMNSADVTATLLEADGVTEVTGETWPIVLAYEAASNGNYKATLTDVLVLTAKKKYFCNLVADGGAGLHADWTVPVRAQTRFE